MSIWKVVIGANYGDEGKGLIVDYLAHQFKQVSTNTKHVLNVRFNGGGQAGHTVVTPDGIRHVFSHTGAGTFSSAETYLTRSFIVNPVIYCLERHVLSSKISKIGNFFVDQNCPVTTPFDVGFNRMIETKRGNARHGSCGAGIGETMERHTAAAAFELNVEDLTKRASLLDKLDHIKEVWVPCRASELGLDPVELIDIANNILTPWLSAVDEFLQHAIICNDEVLQYFEYAVFEGAQGLALDQKLFSSSNPYVTRSNCGITNVIDLARWMKQLEIEVTYVSRCYLTRHGRGFLPNEKSMPSWVIDNTNKPNDWQESLRYAPNTFSETIGRIKDDLLMFKDSPIKISADLAVTCLDQIPSQDLLSSQMQLIIEQSRYNSWGPTRIDVREKKTWINF